jgi:hypothetical protein
MRRALIASVALTLVATIHPAAAQCVAGGSAASGLAVNLCSDGSYTSTIGARDLQGRVGAGANGLEVTNVPFVADDLTLGPNGPGLGNSELAGPTAIDSSLGNGGLTAGLTPEGTVAVLSWPNPSYFNQMDYLTLSRGDPNLGAAKNMGAFAGLDVATAHGRAFSWLRDWPSTQAYLSGTSDALVTTFTRNGITVTQTAVVSTTSDVMTIRYKVQGARDPKLVFFENLNPADHKMPFLPGQDQFGYMANDMAAQWQNGMLVHFREDVDPTKVLNVAEGSTASARDTLVRDLSEMSKPGVFFAVTSNPAPSAHQVGMDLGGFGSGDAYNDATSHGGQLSGDNTALGQVDAAISLPFKHGVADVVMAAGSTNDEAVQRARATSFGHTLLDEESYWNKWLANAQLPTSSADLNVDRRALIAVANATDRSGGSIVASIARQSPYSEDWTRDGAFLNYALDLAGHPEMVTKHNLFYARVQRANGTWGTMYYADGEEGGPFPYESDQQGFGTWTLWQHYKMYPSKSYLDAVWPAIKASANWMTLYAEPTGRQGPGMEDDNFFPSDGMQGAVTQWMGLQSAVRAAGVMGDAADAAKWSARAATLKATILSKYWGPSGSFSPGSPGIAQNLLYQGDPNSAAWIIWPAGLLDPTVPAEREKLFVLARYLYDYMSQQIATAPQLFYEQKAIASLGVYLGIGFNFICNCDPGRVREWSDLYHGVLRTPTWHFGEQIWRTGPNTWVDRVDMPHVWSGVYVYLDAMALTRPDLVPYRPWS